MAFNTVTVTNSATEIVGANAMRLSLIIENNSANTIYIGQDTTLTAANGIPILQNATLTEDSGGTKMYCGPVYGITASSTADVRYWERVR